MLLEAKGGGSGVLNISGRGTFRGRFSLTWSMFLSVSGCCRQADGCDVDVRFWDGGVVS